jgi:drug/metabolite transporter (DMT)-like permease
MLLKYKNYLLLHFIVFIYGFTGIFGALITIPAVNLVWVRMLIAGLCIFIYLLWRKTSLKDSSVNILKFLGTGVIVAIHWIFFYEAIKVSNISVTVACLSSATLFTAIIEPIIFKRKLYWYEALFGLLIMAGLFMIFKVETQYKLGIFYTLFSSFMASLFTVINGTFAKKYDAAKVSAYEMLGGFIAISIYFLVIQVDFTALVHISLMDMLWLIILAVVCTAFAMVANISVMKELSPYSVTMAINLEPVYSIILAFWIFGEKEQMTSGFYIGTLVILATIFANAYIKSRMKKQVDFSQ